MLKFDGSYLPNGTYTTSTQSLGAKSAYLHHSMRMNVTKKTPTFYAVLEYKGTQTNVFVKGGFKGLNQNILYQCWVDELKPLFGLAKIGTHIALLDTPNKVNSEYFLIMRDFGPGVKHYPTVQQEGITKIDKDNIPMLQMVRWLKKNSWEQHPGWLQHYIDILFFRQIVESSDTNNTNFIVNPTQPIPLLSVDENHKGAFLNGKLFSHRPTNQCLETVLQFTKQHKDQLVSQLDDWLATANSEAFDQICQNFANVRLQDRIVPNIKSLKTLVIQERLY
ncbi:MAG TPA: hypothetical protein DCS93_05840 [Microscillaceae bacterium]|nr:hypothetical protein [Microscillaceae bacterium]